MAKSWTEKRQPMTAHYQRSHNFRRSENYFGASFTSVNLTKVNFQTTVIFQCQQ